MGSIKQARTAERIQEIMSELLMFQVSDPGLAAVTVTDVKIDRELRHANIYVSALGDDEAEEEVMAGLKRAHGFLRRELAQRLHLRLTPQLHFYWDPTLASAQRINSLLDSMDIPDAPDAVKPDTDADQISSDSE